MATRFDNETIGAYAQVVTTLEALRAATTAIMSQAKATADGEPFKSVGLDEFHQPNNAVLDILNRLGCDIDQTIHAAREAIGKDLNQLALTGTEAGVGEYGA